MAKPHNLTAVRIFAFAISLAAIFLIAAQPPPPIVGKWEQVSGTSFLSGTGALWEFFEDGTLTINGYAVRYSLPDQSHLKLEFGQAAGLVYPFTLTADEFRITDPNSQSQIMFRRYRELPLTAQTLAGTWEGLSTNIQCFGGLGLESAPLRFAFTADGSFAIQDDRLFSKTFLLGHFTVSGNRVHITAAGTVTTSGFLGGNKQEEVGGEAECEAAVSHARLIFKDTQGESTSYTRSESAEVAATQFPHPTATPSPTPTPTVPDAKIVYVPIEIRVLKSESRPGWSDVTIQLVAENRGGKPYEGEWPRSGTVTVAEGFTYPATIGGFAPWGGLSEGNNFGLKPILAPGFRVLAPPYETSIADTTHLKSLVFETGDEINLEKTSVTPTFPNDAPLSRLAPLPDVIEVPKVARLTIDSFSPPTAIPFLNPGWGDVPGEAAFLNVSYQNLNIGQDQELPIKRIAFFDGRGIVKPWDSTVLFENKLCQAGNTGLGFISLVDTNWPFIAGPGQSRQSQLCIRLGKEEGTYSLGPVLSAENLKVLVWVDDETWRIYSMSYAEAPSAATPPPGGATTAVPITATPLAITATPPSVDSSKAQQIVFAVRDGKFTYLKVEGMNQRGEWSEWQQEYGTPQTIALTQDYWWQGTIVLTFDVDGVGRRNCVLDYMQEAPGSTMAAITFTDGKGCTGEAGSAAKAGLIGGLAEYMTTEDSYKIVDAAQFALDTESCVKGIITGMASPATKLLTIRDCAGASLFVINGVLEKYSKQVTDR